MQSQTRLVRRESVYYFRARIPADLKGHFGRKREIVESLKTKDKREAERLVRLKSVALDEKFAGLRRNRFATPRTSITEAEIAHLVEKAMASRLGADEESRVAGLSDVEWQRHQEWLAKAERLATSAVARGHFGELHARIEDWLLGHHYELPRESEGYRKFAMAFCKAQARMNAQIRARDGGEVVDTPSAPPETTAGGRRATLNDLCGYWMKQKNPRAKTRIEAESILRRFSQVNGEIAPVDVQKKHVIAFRDFLVQQGRAPGTVKKLLGLLGGMFQVAVEDDQCGVQVNPVRDVKVRGTVGEAKARKAFSVEDLNAIFSSPVFTSGERPKAGAGEAAYWLPLLGLFTGARLNEVGQTRVHDVKKEGGVDFIHFTNQGEGMQLKKDGQSRKRVPIHPELARLGFLRYVEKMRHRRDERLFPDLKPDSHGHITGRWSKWFNRYLDDAVGITDREKDFHSFRHTFKHHARASNIAEDQHDALTGHANPTVSRDYGSSEGYPLRPLEKAIKRLRFPGLRLPPALP